MPVPLPDFKYRTFKTSWNDAMAPAFALGAGASAPTVKDFIAPTRLLTFDPTKEDCLDFTVQLPHDLELDVSTVSLHPHVHWTAITSPAANATVVWQMTYTFAKPSTATEVSSFYNIQSLTSSANTMTGAEYRKHYVTDLGNFDMPVRFFAPSAIIVGNLRVSSLSTVAKDIIGVLSVDFHYQSGPVGTDTEYV